MFLGKLNLRGKGENYKFTPELLEEYFKCAEDIIYFAEKYFYIVDLDEGKHRITLYDFQKKALKVFASDEYDGRKNAIILMPRQMGKCIFSDSLVTIKNRKTGEIKDIRVDDLYINSSV